MEEQLFSLTRRRSLGRRVIGVIVMDALPTGGDEKVTPSKDEGRFSSLALEPRMIGVGESEKERVPDDISVSSERKKCHASSDSDSEGKAL